jgi:hypothetical protein
MLFKQRKTRGFQYEPRYNREGEKKLPKSFGFSRTMPKTATGSRSILFIVVLAALVLYLFFFFRRYQQSPPDSKIEVENIIVE